MSFDYYLQNDSTQSVRRYPAGSPVGERWDCAKRVWSTECADRRSCELTHDLALTEADALKRAR